MSADVVSSEIGCFGFVGFPPLKNGVVASCVGLLGFSLVRIGFVTRIQFLSDKEFDLLHESNSYHGKIFFLHESNSYQRKSSKSKAACNNSNLSLGKLKKNKQVNPISEDTTSDHASCLPT